MEFGETIAAIATAPGVGASSIIRVVGQNAFQTAEKIFINKTRPMEWQSHTCRVGSLVDPKNGEIIDQVLISCMKAPNSYTGYDTVEINCHGGVLNTKKILELVLALGVRLAEPGEFTRLAFLNGKMDLSRVEAVADLISAKTDAARRASAAQLMGSLADDVRGLRSQLLKLCSLMELDLDFGEENLLEIGANQIKHQIQSVLDHARRLSST
ncbi:MAG: tRNA uridine-5-carboxymethylaminomethyl(34) synthesis GTPase MnmE, partial [Bacteroidetes bacterium]|nr:tRNA uridine-5-carboxymethylaminomethyl(34) synthesis GTPase MnmE [Bacteroidota bacterium]